VIDPAALGTLTVGLDAIRRDDAAYARGVPREARRRPSRRRIRHGVAAILRRTAEVFEPSPVPAG
jgi:hypothetical protein